jgi:acetyltransferase-like isoleucine patch superfamily enzyme
MAIKIASTAVIHPGVIFGKNTIVEDYCIVGLPFKGMKNEKTIIGDNAIIRAGTYIYAGNRIGDNFQAGNKANIRELNTIGDDVSIGTLSVIEHHVSIDNGVRIHSQAFIPEYSVLDKESWIGPNVVLTNAKYPTHPHVKDNISGVHVKERAIIGANSTILPGVVVGAGSLVGAGSTVSKSVPESVVISGKSAVYKRTMDY